MGSTFFGPVDMGLLGSLSLISYFILFNHNSLESFDVYWDFLRHPEREPPQHKRGTLRRAQEPPPRRSHNRSVATLDSAPLTTLFTTAPVPSS